MSIISTFLEVYFTGPKSILFYPEYQKIFLSGFLDSKKNKGKKRRFFDKNHGLNTLENVDFFRLCENLTFEVQKALFSIQNIKECFFLAFLARKKTFEKRSIF